MSYSSITGSPLVFMMKRKKIKLLTANCHKIGLIGYFFIDKLYDT